MKKRFTVLLIIVLSFSQYQSKAQNAQFVQNATIWANKVAQKMRDTLNLDSIQYNKILQINIDMIQKRAEARKSISNDVNQLTKTLQSIENARDGLYKPVLTKEQYGLYRLRKDDLISN